MVNFLSDIANAINRSSPDYVAQQQAVRDKAQQGQLLGVAMAVLGVAMTVLGIALCSSGILGALIGAPLILISVPISVFGYDIYRYTHNVETFANNPSKFCTFGGFGTLDKDKLIAHLQQGTIFLAPMIGKLADEIN